MQREALLYPGEDGYIVAEVPGLPGCVSQGKTRDEALQNIKYAIEAYVAALEEDNLPVPRKRHVDRLHVPAINRRDSL